MKKDKLKSKAGGGAKPNLAKKKSRFLTTFICIFLGIIIVFGAVMGIMIGVRNARSLVRYDNVVMEEGVINFFSSRFKDMYLDSVSGSSDTEQFWESDGEGGKTHGELLSEKFDSYISDIMVANRLFYRFSTLTIADEECIAESVDWVIKLYAGGSVEEFNRLTVPYGFSYGNFVTATEMLYRAEKAKAVIYGASGENLGADTESERCYEYLNENYTHAALVFIGTEYKNEWNSETGRYDKVLIGEAELEERLDKIERIDTLINNFMNGSGDEWISTDDFERLLGSYESDPEMKEKGYYFRRGTEYTEMFYERFAPVVDRALEMEVGDYARVDLNVPPEDGDYGFVGTCFIYKYNVQWGAWLDGDNLFLSDFLPLAADYYFSLDLETLGEEVVFTDAYRKTVNVLTSPRNDDYYVKTWR